MRPRSIAAFTSMSRRFIAKFFSIPAALKNNTIAVLQEIEKIRSKTNIDEDAVFDENRLSAKWDVRRVDPNKYPADLIVHVA